MLVGCGPSVPDISIHKAAEEGNIKVVKQHLAAGTDVNAKGWSGRTPLHLAIPNEALRDSKGKLMSPNNMDLVELLIAKGADVNAKDDDGRTPLHYAGTKEVTALLIAKGADVNVTNDEGGAPLHRAAYRGHEESAELLIANGANVNSLNEEKETPLDTLSSKELEGVTAEIAILLRKHGGKTAEELDAAGN